MVALIAVLYAPTLAWMVRCWWLDPNQGHGFLVAPVLGALLWSRRREMAEIERAPRVWGLWLCALSVVVHVWAVREGLLLFSSLTIAPLIAGLLVFLRGPRLAMRLWGLLSLSFFMVPFPFAEAADIGLVSLSAKAGGLFLRAVGVQARIVGAEIEIPGASFVVGAACSGFRSSVALMMLGAVLAVLVHGRPSAKLALLVAVAPIAFFTNAVRIASIVLVASLFGAHAAMAYYHDGAGIVAYVVALAALFGVTRALGCGVRDVTAGEMRTRKECSYEE